VPRRFASFALLCVLIKCRGTHIAEEGIHFIEVDLDAAHGAFATHQGKIDLILSQPDEVRVQGLEQCILHIRFHHGPLAPLDFRLTSLDKTTASRRYWILVLKIRKDFVSFQGSLMFDHGVKKKKKKKKMDTAGGN
jgi:hypothetical protein